MTVLSKPVPDPSSCQESVLLCNFFCLPGDLSTTHQYLCLLFHRGGLGGVPSAPALTVWLQGGRCRALEAVTDVIPLTSCISPHQFHIVSGVGQENHRLSLALNGCNSTRLDTENEIFLVNQVEKIFILCITYLHCCSVSQLLCIFKKHNKWRLRGV